MILGVLGKVFPFLISQETKWKIEKKRKQLKSKKDLLLSCRKFLEKGPTKAEFQISIEYSRIKPFLSQNIVELVQGQFDKNGHQIIEIVLGGPNAGVNPFIGPVLDDLSRLEHEWGLL